MTTQASRILRAGPLTTTYLDGDLRGVQVAGLEAIRRVYLVFQDINWTARPWLIENEQINAAADSFSIHYDVRGTFDATALHGTVRIAGSADGEITFSVDLSAGDSIWRNRLGLCVLHPMDASGQPCLVETVGGEFIGTTFPVAISPHQPFVDIRAISHEVEAGIWATLRLEGETFEMEDHRNWSDASFKTYCTPISLPFPVQVEAGDRIQQSARISLGVAEDVDLGGLDCADELHDIFLLDEVAPLPALGLQVAADDTPSQRQLDLLRSLGLDHLRLDIQVADPSARDLIARAADQAEAIGASLIVAVTVDDVTELEQLADLSPRVGRWLVFDAHAKVTGPDFLAAAKAALGPSRPIGGGTNLYFTELNREPLAAGGADFVAFSVNPQVHAWDDLTIVQNAETQWVIGLNATRVADQMPIFVGPVTLRPRFNPNATAPDRDVSSTPLPSSIDVRQLSAWAAGWLAMSLKYLAQANTVAAITYFETVGWRGVMEREEGSRQPANFPSSPGEPFPVYDILVAVRGFTRARESLATNPQHVDALVLEDDTGRRRGIIANFTDEPQDVLIEGFATPVVRVEPMSYAIVDGRTQP